MVLIPILRSDGKEQIGKTPINKRIGFDQNSDDEEHVLKILMVTIGYPPDEIGGTETYVQGLAEALRDQGHTIHICYLQTRRPIDCSDIAISQRTENGILVHMLQVNTMIYKLETIAFDSKLRERLIGF